MKALTLTAAGTSLLACLVLHAAHAQAPAPASAAAKSDKLVTRDELRVCMNSETDLAARRKAFGERIDKNKQEADAIRAERAELTEEEKGLGDNDGKIRRFKAKVTAHNAKVQAAQASAATFNTDLDAFNKSLVAHNDKCGGISYSSEDKAAILAEQAAKK